MSDVSFVACRHAGPLVAENLRMCRSPQVVGLGNVTPGMCSECVYRDLSRGAAQLTSDCRRLVDCAHFGAPLGTDETGISRYECRHPGHAVVTRRDCSACRDYLFPLLTPRMSVADCKQHRGRAPVPQPSGWWRWPNVQAAERELADEQIRQSTPYPGHKQKRGIIIVGGGKYLPAAYVTAHVLRHLRCRLPIQLWHLAGEVPRRALRLLGRLDVTCVDADALRRRHPFRFLDDHWWKGWQLKAYALLHAPFREVLMLDADCYPVRDPTFLFHARPYLRHGAVFWPDIGSSRFLLSDRKMKVFGIGPFQDRPAESGQLLVDRRRSWPALRLAAHYNAQADFTYRTIWGDKDTFPIAWKRLGIPYGRLWPTSRPIREGILQYDEAGETLFLHRCTAKLVLQQTRFDSTPGQQALHWNYSLPLEEVCHHALHKFARKVKQLEAAR